MNYLYVEVGLLLVGSTCVSCEIILGSEGKNRKDIMNYQSTFWCYFTSITPSWCALLQSPVCPRLGFRCFATYQGNASLMYYYLVSVELSVDIYCFL